MSTASTDSCGAWACDLCLCSLKTLTSNANYFYCPDCEDVWDVKRVNSCHQKSANPSDGYWDFSTQSVVLNGLPAPTPPAIPWQHAQVGAPLANPIVLTTPAPTPPYPYVDPFASVDSDDFMDAADFLGTKSIRPSCLDCARELSEYLDQYWGRDDYWGRFCSPCRSRRGVK